MEQITKGSLQIIASIAFLIMIIWAIGFYKPMMLSIAELSNLKPYLFWTAVIFDTIFMIIVLIIGINNVKEAIAVSK